MSAPINVTVTLDNRLALMLAVNASPNFVRDQSWRFEVLDADRGTCPLSPEFVDATVSWCLTMSDAFLFRAYEQACGHQTILLSDLADGFEDQVVVLSSRPFAHGEPGDSHAEA